MAISLASLRKGRKIAPPRLVVYGVQGIGKNEFGNSAPNCVFIQCEDGLSGIDVKGGAFELCKTWDAVMEQLEFLLTQEHDFMTLCFDSLDWFEPIVHAETAKRNGQKDIESFGYGKGYKAADAVWLEFLDKLNALRDARNMQVILTSHFHIKRFDDPSSVPYDRYMIKLHDRASALVQEWADAVLFFNWQTYTQETDVGFKQKVTRGVGTGIRVLHTRETPAYVAKNRYGLPPTIMIPEGAQNNYAAFGNALSQAAAA